MPSSHGKRKADAIAEEPEEENHDLTETTTTTTTNEEHELLVTEQASSDDSPPPQYTQGEKVLARDNDGLLYIAFVRRAMYGIPQHHKLDLIGTIDGGNDNSTTTANNINKDDDDTSPRWYYFVHYLAWKVNWDRWVAEQDLLPVTDKYLTWQQTIQTEHRKLLQQFKQGKRVDGGAFLKAWKPKLESLIRSFQGTKKSSTSSTNKRVMVKKPTTLFQQEETRKHHLTSRTPAEISSLHLPSGLKRVLVEDWEILNGQFGMVHQLQPETSLRSILDLYLESKGVKQVEGGNVATEETVPTSDASAVDSMDAKSSSVDDSVPASNLNEPKEGGDENPIPLDDTQRRHKEWTDMANGLCQLLDQALPFRLLYPIEQSQLYALLENATDDGKAVSLSKHYGCIHFLRLCCQLPQLLQEQYDDELQQHLVKPLLAKVNDFLRFLQEHHHHAFPQRFRKKSLEEEKLEQKWIKKYEKQRVVGEGEEQ